MAANGNDVRPPLLQTPIEDQVVKAGQEVTLTCTFDLGHPPAKIQWMKSREELPDEGRFSWQLDGGQASLLLRSSVPADAGVYKCVATNSAGSTSCVGNVNVAQSPAAERDTVDSTDTAIVSEQMSNGGDLIDFGDTSSNTKDIPSGIPQKAVKEEKPENGETAATQHHDKAEATEVELIDLAEEVCSLPEEKDGLVGYPGPSDSESCSSGDLLENDEEEAVAACSGAVLEPQKISGVESDKVDLLDQNLPCQDTSPVIMPQTLDTIEDMNGTDLHGAIAESSEGTLALVAQMEGEKDANDDLNLLGNPEESLKDANDNLNLLGDSKESLKPAGDTMVQTETDSEDSIDLLGAEDKANELVDNTPVLVPEALPSETAGGTTNEEVSVTAEDAKSTEQSSEAVIASQVGDNQRNEGMTQSEAAISSPEDAPEVEEDSQVVDSDAVFHNTHLVQNIPENPSVNPQDSSPDAENKVTDFEKTETPKAMVIPEIHLEGRRLTSGDYGDTEQTAPVVGRHLQDITVTVGREAVLECAFNIGVAIAQVRWFKDDTEVIGDDRVQISLTPELVTLTLPRVEQGDAGWYRCEVSNSLGTASTSATLKVADAEAPSSSPAPDEGDSSTASTADEDKLQAAEVTLDNSSQDIDALAEVEQAQNVVSQSSSHNDQVAVSVTGDSLDETTTANQDNKDIDNEVRERTDRVTDEDMDSDDETVTDDDTVTNDDTDTSGDVTVDTEATVTPSGGESKEAEGIAVNSTEASSAPVVDEDLVDVTVAGGATAKLTCSFFELDDEAQVSWYKDGVLLEKDVKYKISVYDGYTGLQVPSFSATDAGVYTCTASNPAGQASTSCRVIYQEEKRYEIQEGLAQADIAGQTITLRCPHLPGVDKTSVKWLKDGHELPSGGRYKVSTTDSHSVLTIDGATDADYGQYQCDPSGVQINLYPQGGVKPEVVNPLTDIAVYTGRSVDLRCAFRNTDQESLFQWFKNGERLKESPKYTMRNDGREAILTLQCACAEDAGHYGCKATNRWGSVSTGCQMGIIRERKVGHTNPLGTADGLKGRRVLLKFPCSHPSRARNVRWFKDGIEIQNSKRIEKYARGSTAYLIIHSASEQDHGIYTCQPGNARVRLIKHSELAPRVKQPLRRHLTACETISVWLMCSFHNLNGTVKISWEKDGRLVTPNERIELGYRDGTAKLLLRDVTRADAGTYRCVAANRYGHAASTCELTVLEGRPKSPYVQLLAQTILTKAKIDKMNLPQRIRHVTDMKLLLELLAANFPDLHALYLNDNNLQLGPAVIRVLAQFCHLRSLRLDGNILSESGIYALELVLRYLSDLELFGISRCIYNLRDHSCVERITEALGRHCPHLRGLDISDNGIRVHPEMALIRPLARCKELRRLLLPGNKFTEEGLINLKEIVEDMPQLESLGLYDLPEPEVPRARAPSISNQMGDEKRHHLEVAIQATRSKSF